MFQSLDRVVYQVTDIQQAQNWYNNLLKTEPVFASPLIVIYHIGSSSLALVPIGNASSQSNERIVAFWSVTEIDTAFQCMLDAGATKHTDITPVLNTKIAKVIDPFGNIIGITGKDSAKPKSLENKPSETAMTVAFCRALATVDEREELRGPDYLAEIFLTEDGKRPLKDQAARKWVMDNLMTGGVYEYFIARTAYLDQVVADALRENIPQIVFLGAGYDTRSYRLRELIRDTKIFEVDIISTQQRKKQLLETARISIPEQLTFISINFEKDDFSDLFAKAGFKRNHKTLFIWEGVTYYLTPEAVDSTLDFVKNNSPAGSTICFDYSADAPDMDERYGVKQTKESMKATYTAERVQFKIAEGTIDSFLTERGYQMTVHLTPEEMERMYLTLGNGTLAGKVVANLCLVQAVVTN
ncbi:MAG: SAM-dependent methyltransferase [Bacteroidota bacterium]